MKRLQSENVLAGSANFRVPSGQYAGFMLRASGTNQAGQTLTAANLGLITATWRGVPWLNIRFDDLNVLSQMTGGVAETATAAGAAFTHSAFIKSNYRPDGNIFDITDDDDVWISVNLSGVTGVIVVSGTIELFGIPEMGAQAYVPKLFQYVHSVGASGSTPETVPHENVAALMLTNLTNLARVQVEKDRQVVVAGSAGDCLAVSNYETQVETALTTAIFLDLARSGGFDEKLSDDVSIILDAGAGGALAARVTSISVDPTPDVLARSRATVDNAVAVKHARKMQLNKKRSVVTSNAINGVK